MLNEDEIQENIENEEAEIRKAEFGLTEKAWEQIHPHLELRQLSLCLISELTIDNEPDLHANLDIVQSIETTLGQLGHSGPEVDVAKCAEARFRLEDAGIMVPLWSKRAAKPHRGSQ